MVHVAAGCFGLLRFERTVEDPDTVRAAGFFGGSTGWQTLQCVWCDTPSLWQTTGKLAGNDRHPVGPCSPSCAQPSSTAQTLQRMDGGAVGSGFSLNGDVARQWRHGRVRAGSGKRR
ncbi:hypothetical protein JCM16408A_53140 [Methylobacterium phyllosphaerae]